MPPLEPPGRSRSWLGLSSLSGPVLGFLAVLLLFVALIGLKGGGEELGKFLRFRNVQVLMHEATIPGVLALGMLMVIVSGGIDLSVGSVVALVTVVTMQLYRALYDGPDSATGASLLAVTAGVAVGGLCGLTNGLVITRLRVAPFVATLGMFGIARGLAVWLAERRQLAFPRGGRPEWVESFARVHPEFTLFNPGFWSLVLLAGFVALVLRYSVFGRYTYAIGSSEATARLCGVPVERYQLGIYTFAGLLTGWAGVLLLTHGDSGDPSAGVGLELEVIAAVVIGGASLAGGRGTVGGALLGVLILGILANGVSLFNVPIEVQHILIGVIIIANTSLSQWQRRER